MNTSSIWPLRTSTTAAPRREARKPTASASASTKPSCRSSIRWRSANASTPASSSCRPTSMPGSPGTTNSDHIRGAGVTARRQCKPSLTPSRSPGRNHWPPDVGQTQPFRHQTGQLSDQVSASTNLARTKRGRALYSLHHVIDLDWMMEAYRLTRKDGAPGIDGVTAADYEVNLEANLLDLLDRIKSGRYRAPPVRRAYIPKADGSQRMLGIPTFEDKVAQRAVTMVLEEIYEQDFLSCSYGFRPGRSAHQALRTLQNVLWAKRLYWVLDIDIRKYFDSISHSQLRAFLDQRVTDGVIRRMIDKWLKAGAVEDGFLRRTTEGSPQGGVISPCLSNVFLHHVLDEWFETVVKPRLRGEGTLVRFADDALMAFDNIVDAKRVL